MNVPPQCITGAIVGAGASLFVSSFHNSVSELPTPCLVGSFAGSTALAGALAHHASTSTMPSWECWAGLAFLGPGVYTAIAQHNKSSTSQVKPAEVHGGSRTVNLAIVFIE